MSISCRLLTSTALVCVSPMPQLLQYAGMRLSIMLGFATIFRLLPLCPSCPPGLRPDDFLRLLVCLGGTISVEGGFELLRLFFTISCSLRSDISFCNSFTRIDKSRMIESLFISKTRSNNVCYDPNIFCDLICSE